MCYAGSLYSMMTIPTNNPTIDTIEYLAKEQSKGNIQILALNSSFYHEFKVFK